MYIKLGNTAINYSSTNIDDFMILSEVVDSGLSYESPTIVRDVNELDIWFGQDIKDRDFLIELLQRGISLYLYKPISTVDNSKLEDQINKDDYIAIDPREFGYENASLLMLDNITKFKTTSNLKYRGKDNNGLYVATDPRTGELTNFSYYLWTGIDFEKQASDPGETFSEFDLGGPIPIFNFNSETQKQALIYIKEQENIKVSTINDDGTEWYYWVYGEFVPESNLTQSMVNTSDSLNLRSTILISPPPLPSDDYDDAISYPDYLTGMDELGIYNKEGKKWLEFSVDREFPYDLEKLNKGYQSFVFTLNLGDLKEWPEDKYLIIPFPDTYKGLCFYNGSIPKEAAGHFQASHNVASSPLIYYWKVISQIPEGKDWTEYEEFPGPSQNNVGSYIRVEEEFYVCTKTKDYKEGIKEGLRENHFHFNEDLTGICKNSETETNLLKLFPITNFTNIDEISLIPDHAANNALLFNTMKENKGIEFWSKTIGSVNEFDSSGIITVTIELIEGYRYRVKLQRYSYSEVFEGTTTNKYGEERLDYKISRESKLCRCTIYNENLRPGTYKLSNPVVETYDRGMWQRALSTMFVEDRIEGVCPDYFMVSDIDKYYDTNSQREKEDESEYSIYETFLKYAKESTCQFLIQNNDRVAFENDYLYNKVDTDKYNYLVYFYKDMSVKYSPRPGYYAFLIGLFDNRYEVSTNTILYDCPTKNPYEVEDIEETLIKYRSNYLVCDNKNYYYKQYLNGKDYSMTLWMRFVAGKIYRELEKNKYQYIGTKFMGEMQETVENLINRITTSFGIVNRIEVTDFDKDEANNTLNISLDVGVNDLVNNNLKLDITINYTDYSYGSSS